jgi:hypothetical protein
MDFRSNGYHLAPIGPLNRGFIVLRMLLIECLKEYLVEERSSGRLEKVR